MVTENFRSAEELYNHIYPALHSKCEEFHAKRLSFVTEKMIWKCLKELKWKEDNQLTIADMVSDIFNLEAETLLTFLNNKK